MGRTDGRHRRQYMGTTASAGQAATTVQHDHWYGVGVTTAAVRSQKVWRRRDNCGSTESEGVASAGRRQRDMVRKCDIGSTKTEERRQPSVQISVGATSSSLPHETTAVTAPEQKWRRNKTTKWRRNSGIHNSSTHSSCHMVRYTTAVHIVRYTTVVHICSPTQEFQPRHH